MLHICIYALHNMQSTVNVSHAVSRDDFGPNQVRYSIISLPLHLFFAHSYKVQMHAEMKIHVEKEINMQY